MSAQIIHLADKRQALPASRLERALVYAGFVSSQGDADLADTLGKAKAMAVRLREAGYSLLGVDGTTLDGEPILRIEPPSAASPLAEQAWRESHRVAAHGDYCGLLFEGCWIYWSGIAGDAPSQGGSA